MRKVKLMDVYQAVANEMAYNEDQSKDQIANIVKIYIKNLRSEGYKVRLRDTTTVNSCARIVNYLSSKTYKKNNF